MHECVGLSINMCFCTSSLVLFLLFVCFLNLTLFYYLHACLFPFRDRKGMDSDEEGGVKNLRGFIGEEAVMGIYCIKIHFQ